MVRLERYKRVPIVGLPVGILVLIVFAIWPAELSLTEVAVLLAVGGAGLGTMYPVTTVLIQNAVLPHQLGTATGTLNFFRQLGGAMIVAVFAAIVFTGIDAGEGAARWTSSRVQARGRRSLRASFASCSRGGGAAGGGIPRGPRHRGAAPAWAEQRFGQAPAPTVAAE